MTDEELKSIEEFSNSFTTLLNSYAHQADAGEQSSRADIVLDEYEKSLFLTKAQEEVVLGLYNGRNPYGESFEQSEELRKYLAPLVKDDTKEPIVTTNGNPLGIDSNSKFFSLPEDLWFIIYESVNISNGDCASMTTQEVYPVTHDEYHKLKKNPFRGANRRRALRLDCSEGVVEIVSKYQVSKYYVRYLKKLEPIILVDLPEGLTINGEDEAKPCKLHQSLHQRILDMAVRMALVSKGYRINNENN